MNLKGARVVVTGCNGMIGRHVCERLGGENCRPIVTVSGSAWDRLQDTLSVKTDCIFHCAGVTTGVHHSAKHPASQLVESLGIDLALYGAIAANPGNVGKVVALGCGCAYPWDWRRGHQVFSESDYGQGLPDGEHRYFAAAKQMIWTLAQAFHKEHGVISHVLVPSNVYGPWDNFDHKSSHVVASLIRKNYEAMKSVGPVVVWGDGSQRRDFIHAGDVADAMVAVAMQDCQECRLFNVCGPDGQTSIGDLARGIKAHTGAPIYNDLSGPAGDEERMIDDGEIHRSIGWFPNVHLSDGIRETWEWYCKMREGKE